MEAAILCEAMGWTYNEYLEQPADFIHTIASMLNAREQERAKREKEASTK